MKQIVLLKVAVMVISHAMMVNVSQQVTTAMAQLSIVTQGGQLIVQMALMKV
jgi:hypothetical protein